MICRSIGVVILAIGVSIAPAQADGELRFAPPPARTMKVVPAFLLGRSTFNTAGCTCHFGEENVTDFDLTLRALGWTNASRHLAIGFELRQLFGRIDNRNDFDIFGTRLGLRLEENAPWSFAPTFGVAWFFGDTIVSRLHDEQFNGNTLALSASAKFGPVRWLAEISGGQYHEGPGFIALSRRAGDELLATRSVKVGAEFPFEVPTPDWLVTGPPAVAE